MSMTVSFYSTFFSKRSVIMVISHWKVPIPHAIKLTPLPARQVLQRKSQLCRKWPSTASWHHNTRSTNHGRNPAPGEQRRTSFAKWSG